MAIARCDLNRLTFFVFQMLQAEVHVALRCHQLQAVAFSEFVFYGDGGQRAFTLAGEVAYKLLAFGNRIAMLVVLVVVVGMSTQETFV